MEPLELLKEKLYEYEKSLQKSFESNRSGKIDNETHLIHKNNLKPKIFNYKQAINLLEQWNLTK
jgi:hypothetical protein